ncbi:hypothetical protein NEUTE1DRAFT_112328 [Neurospora tetrasperma FGSC 2508]|uniref:Uncharacterized protein n=1 Tax=Neurospora tetrasperma (strain FGSC 2508 / ATCC MYA-4615 / P0657) TaxID=510951 RepID=F8MS54_NEUT8|nr:uncharacterized protein NEUTE1DRAFT_112328 [Neurospora tetrasperma FGSC 2508]EGO55848.1 hypothetical protein NEUTE1DRAFT_112328 [Neurospora tetrasperma FGSC 2508]
MADAVLPCCCVPSGVSGWPFPTALGYFGNGTAESKTRMKVTMCQLADGTHSETGPRAKPPIKMRKKRRNKVLRGHVKNRLKRKRKETCLDEWTVTAVAEARNKHFKMVGDDVALEEDGWKAPPLPSSPTKSSPRQTHQENIIWV